MLGENHGESRGSCQGRGEIKPGVGRRGALTLVGGGGLPMIGPISKRSLRRDLLLQLRHLEIETLT